MKRLFFLILGIAVSAGCFGFSLKGTNFNDLETGFRNANYWTLPLMMAMLFGFYWLKVIRWQWLLAPSSSLTVRDLFPPMLTGFAANNVLPAHLGEFVRVFVVRQKFGVPAATVLSTVVLERIFDVLSILALFVLGLNYSDDLRAKYEQATWIVSGGAAFVVACVAIYLIWTEFFLKTCEAVCRFLPFIPDSLTSKILDMLRSGAVGLAALRSGKMVLAIAINSLLQWLLNGALAFVALKAFGVPVTLATGLIVTGVTAFGVTIPSTPGYFGVIQACFTISLAAQAVKPDPSLVLASSLYYHISMYIPVTVIGLYFLQQSGLKLSDIRRNEEPVVENSV